MQEWLTGGDISTLKHACVFDVHVKMRVTHEGTSLYQLPVGRYTVPFLQLLS